MSELIEKLAICVERGKVNKTSPYPPDMKEQDGADELAKAALDSSLDPNMILSGCMKGMQAIGEKFSNNQAFVPELLMSARAMTAAFSPMNFYSLFYDKKSRFVFS